MAYRLKPKAYSGETGECQPGFRLPRGHHGHLALHRRGLFLQSQGYSKRPERDLISASILPRSFFELGLQGIHIDHAREGDEHLNGADDSSEHLGLGGYGVSGLGQSLNRGNGLCGRLQPGLGRSSLNCFLGAGFDLTEAMLTENIGLPGFVFLDQLAAIARESVGSY